MKFIHIADMHFDTPFTTLNKKNLGNARRLEQRRIFKEIIEYAKQNQIESLFICGDLYEHEYVKQSTIEYINTLFKEIPNTQIYMVPGNHDPILKNSYYHKFDWNSNVTIFKETVEKIQTKEADIYGFGFSDFYLKNTKLQEIQIDDPNKINILLTHGSVDTSSEEDKQYNSMTKRELKALGFDYIALGHIHKPSFQEEPDQRIIYPGSTMSLGFDELGQHGMLVGEITLSKKVSIQFVELDSQEFIEQEVVADEINSKEELIEKINAMEEEENKYKKIILTGKRNFEIDVYSLYPYLTNPLILKIKDKTTIKIDLEKLAKQDNLKGIFVKNMLGKLNQEEQDNEVIQKAIEIGLEAM